MARLLPDTERANRLTDASYVTSISGMAEPTVSLHIRMPAELREAIVTEANRRGSPIQTTTIDLLRKSLSRVPVKRITS
jgi:DNA-binding transcriptional ArsR family regulator